jgi:hypothetical protein
MLALNPSARQPYKPCASRSLVLGPQAKWARANQRAAMQDACVEAAREPRWVEPNRPVPSAPASPPSRMTATSSWLPAAGQRSSPGQRLAHARSTSSARTVHDKPSARAPSPPARPPPPVNTPPSQTPGSVAPACKRPLNARLATGVGPPGQRAVQLQSAPPVNGHTRALAQGHAVGSRAVDKARAAVPQCGDGDGAAEVRTTAATAATPRALLLRDSVALIDRVPP